MSVLVTYATSNTSGVLLPSTCNLQGAPGTSGATGATGGAGTSGTSGLSVAIYGPTAGVQVSAGATGIEFIGSGVQSVTASGSFVTVTITGGTGGGSGTSGTSGTSGSSGTSGTSGSSGSSGTSGTSGATGANGTSGSSGTSGTGVPAWTSAGVITLTATTTSPVKGTTTSDNIRYRQVGAKEWEIVLTYIQTVGSGNSGSGDYLITLPNSLSFDTTLPSQQIYTGSVGTNTYALMSYIIPSGSGLINNGGLGGQVYPIVYNATQFRILTTSYGSAIQCWGSGYYNLGGDVPKIQLTFSFTST